jgi:proteic killer suppression protein
MKIGSVAHRGLRRFIECGDPSGLPPSVVERVRNVVSFLQEMDDPEELRQFPAWRLHRLTGNRRDTWSLTITGNWRLTFRIDDANSEIVALDFEDYH